MAGSLIEILDTKTRDNYNKIVIHKKMWIPVAEDLSFHSHQDAADTYVQNQKEKQKPPKLININDMQKYWNNLTVLFSTNYLFSGLAI